MKQGLPWDVVSRVMDPRLVDLFVQWRDGDDAVDSLTQFAAHRDNLLIIAVEGAHSLYRHYGAAFAGSFGVDLTGAVIDLLPSAILPADQRGMMEFEYAFAHRHHAVLWRSYTATFGDQCQTWQRLVLPLANGALAVGAYPAAVEESAPSPEDQVSDSVQAVELDEATECLLRMVIARVPVMLDRHGTLSDLALTLKVYSDSRLQIAELEQQATRDPLTGVSNLRHFLHLSRMELDHAMRMGRPLAVLGMDIDHFKVINDTYGHAVGDQALQLFVDVCRKGLRELDIFGRCGGEEFGVTLPNTTAEGARILAERLRQVIERSILTLPDGRQVTFTVSMGVAVYCGDWRNAPSMSIEALRERADQALYQAKRNGRNQVVVADI